MHSFKYDETDTKVPYPSRARKEKTIRIKHSAKYAPGQLIHCEELMAWYIYGAGKQINVGDG